MTDIGLCAWGGHSQEGTHLQLGSPPACFPELQLSRPGVQDACRGVDTGLTHPVCGWMGDPGFLTSSLAASSPSLHGHRSEIALSQHPLWACGHALPTPFVGVQPGSPDTLCGRVARPRGRGIQGSWTRCLGVSHPPPHIPTPGGQVHANPTSAHTTLPSDRPV